MTEGTALDAAHAAMQAAPEDEAVRLRFYERLADAELFLLLAAEAEGDKITPELFDLEDHSFVLTFDREIRMTEFTGRPSPFAALSGRAICNLLAPNELGLGLNLDVAPSSILIPPEAIIWLAQTLDQRPSELTGGIERISPPKGLPEDLLVALDAKLASAKGLAHSAYLAGVTYRDGGRSHLLGVIDAVPGAESAIANAVSELLAFSGLEAATLDVAFFRASDPIAEKLLKCGLRFDLPMPQARVERPLAAPGMDPKKPPILR